MTRKTSKSTDLINSKPEGSGESLPPGYDYPPDLDRKRMFMFDDMVKEMRVMFGNVITADLLIIADACRAAQGQETARLAAQMQAAEGNWTEYRGLMNVAKMEGQTLRQCFVALHMTGEHRHDRADSTIKRMSAASNAGNTAAGQWDKLVG